MVLPAKTSDASTQTQTEIVLSAQEEEQAAGHPADASCCGGLKDVESQSDGAFQDLGDDQAPRSGQRGMGVHLGEIGVAAGASSHPAAAAGADARPAAAAGAAAHPTAEDAAQVDAREHARIRRREREHCCQFLGSIFMFFVFMNLMMTHLAVTHVFWLERTVIARLSDVPFGDHSLKFADVHDYDTFWEWVELALEPALVEQFDAVGNALPHNEWGYIARYNKVIGGVRFYQDRGKESACTVEEMTNFYGRCYPEETRVHDSFGLSACNTTDALAQCAAEADDDGHRRLRDAEAPPQCAAAPVSGRQRRAQRRRSLASSADDDWDAD